MYLFSLCVNLLTIHLIKGDIKQDDLGYLNELPLDKLLRLKNSLQVLVKTNYDNLTSTVAPPSLDMRVDHFGAQALGLNSPLDRGDLTLKPPIKRGDDWEGLTKKGDYGKMSNIFSMAVTVLAFLAFGGYLLCLIVQAIRSKQNFNQMMVTTVAPTTVFLNSGIKKRPQTHFASSSYGRRRRDVHDVYSTDMDLPPEQLFTALLDLCEGYAKWNMQYSD